MTRARRSGALRIFLYNWPTFALTWGGAAVVVAVAVAALLRPAGGADDLTGVAAASSAAWRALAFVAVAGAAVAVSWSAFSLVVSHAIYDRSPLAGGAWAGALLRADATERERGHERHEPARAPLAWASIDAGLDAEVDLERALPGTCVARLDIYDGVVVRAPSVERARALTPRAHGAVSARASALPLADASCDVVAVVFTAHEVRDRAVRERFFAELHRALRPGGRVLLVEHLRDAANFAAFGPGFLHFQPRAEWLRLAAHAGFTIAVETRVTPWVAAFALEKSAASGGAA